MEFSNNDLLSNLLSAQSTKESLMQIVLMALSTSDKVLVFEGDTDYQVYDEWLKHECYYPNAEHLCAKGKSQIISLYKHVKSINHTDIIENSMFYVDQDYDLDSHNDDCIRTLQCYSVENYIVNEGSLVSILKDEFHLNAIKIQERERIVAQFRKDFSCFNEIAKLACKPLFIKHNIFGKTQFYKKITDVIYIEYGN
ncbi:TPA: DUF4435 domain-containing protein, partial [Salmonella enterica subsp. enterica serovar Cerro]